MKQLIRFTALLSASLFLSSNIFGQADCNVGVPACDLPNFTTNSSGPGAVDDIPPGSNISNPTTNPGSAGNSGCLLSNELNPTWLIMSISANGFLEFSLGAGNGGYYDWSMWSYNASTTCAAIQNNTLAPVACNWNASSGGLTGMATPGNIPAGGQAGNFENAIPVVAGESYIICFSNFSGQVGANVPIATSPNVQCNPFVPNYTVCLGSPAIVTVVTPGLPNPTIQWLNTTGVSNPNSGTNVTVNVTTTTTYPIQVTQPATPTTPAQTWTINTTITVVPPPAPNAGPDKTICLGNPVQMAGVPSSAGNTSNWQVIVPPGMSPPATANFVPNANSMTATSTPTQPGVYKYVLRESNATCGTRRDTMLVTVSLLQLTATSTNPLCNGSADGSITINSAGATEYSYDNGATWVPNATAGGFAAGVYNVCAKNALGCQKCTAITLTDPPAITIVASNDTTICQNGTASLMALATGGTSYTYTWDQTTDTGASQSFNPAATITYNVFATSNNGCTSPTEPITVTVREPITGVITPAQTVCPGYSDTLDAAAMGGIGAPYTFTWSNGEIDMGSTGSFTNSPMTNTAYTVTITDGCESTPLVLTSNINVHPLPIPSFDVIDGTLCEPAEFVVYNTTTPEELSEIAYWRLSDGQEVFNSDTLKTLPLTDGNYSVTLVVTSPAGCIDSITQVNYLTSYPLPVPDFRWSPDPVKMFNTEVHFTNHSDGAVSYEWAFESGSPGTSNMDNPVVTFPDGIAATYEVMLIATTEFECRDTIYKDLQVMPEVLLFAPNAFTPDGDEFNQTWRIYIEGVDPYDFELLVYNRWGEIVFESRDINASWDGTYHGKIMPAGNYKWTIRTKDRLNDGKYEWAGDINIIR